MGNVRHAHSHFTRSAPETTRSEDVGPDSPAYLCARGPSPTDTDTVSPRGVLSFDKRSDTTSGNTGAPALSPRSVLETYTTRKRDMP